MCIPCGKTFLLIQKCWSHDLDFNFVRNWKCFITIISSKVKIWGQEVLVPLGQLRSSFCPGCDSVCLSVTVAKKIILSLPIIRSSVSLFMGTSSCPYICIYGDITKYRHIATYGKIAIIACEQNCKELHDENFVLRHERWDHATINTIQSSVKKNYGARYVIQLSRK